MPLTDYEALVPNSETKKRILDRMDTAEILKVINDEDKTVPYVQTLFLNCQSCRYCSRQIERGGQVLVGAGTSGRLGIVDAAECPPTFGVDRDCPR